PPSAFRDLPRHSIVARKTIRIVNRPRNALLSPSRPMAKWLQKTFRLYDMEPSATSPTFRHHGKDVPLGDFESSRKVRRPSAHHVLQTLRKKSIGAGDSAWGSISAPVSLVL